MSRIAARVRARLSIDQMLALSAVGLVIGTISAFATIGFVELVHWLNELLYVNADSRSRLDSGTLAIVTISVLTIGGLLVGLILNYGVKSDRPLGPADTIYAVQLREKLPHPVAGLLSTLAAILSLGCGASVGQYGPVVYLGTLFGQMANRLQLGIRDIRSIAIACGVAAAIATAFNAPIAGLIFTHEVVLRHYSLRIFTSVTVATACGYVVANVVFEHPALFLIDFDQAFHAAEFFLFALEGVACGLLAVAFMKLLARTNALSRQIKIHAVFKPMLAGFLVSIVALQIPEVLGAGQAVLHMATVSGSYGALDLASILVAKVLVTAFCIGFGFAGGVIFPSLLIGVLFGALFAISIPELLLSEYSGLSVYAICGMVALASPVIGAPLTALLIIFEITRNYEVTIAAMVTIVFANLIAYHWYGRSLFDTQLADRGIDLSQGREQAYLQHHKITEYSTQDDSITDTVSESGIQFDENTSLWSAMETMRIYQDRTIPIVQSHTGHRLGTISRTTIINAYLDAIQDLRREEHEV